MESRPSVAQIKAVFNVSQGQNLKDLITFIAKESKIYGAEITPLVPKELIVAHLSEPLQNTCFLMSSAAEKRYTLYLNDIRVDKKKLLASVVYDMNLLHLLRQYLLMDVNFALDDTVTIGEVKVDFTATQRVKFTAHIATRTLSFDLSPGSLVYFHQGREDRLLRLGVLASFESPQTKSSLDDLLSSINAKKNLSAQAALSHLQTAREITSESEMLLKSLPQPATLTPAPTGTDTRNLLIQSAPAGGHPAPRDLQTAPTTDPSSSLIPGPGLQSYAQAVRPGEQQNTGTPQRNIHPRPQRLRFGNLDQQQTGFQPVTPALHRVHELPGQPSPLHQQPLAQEPQLQHQMSQQEQSRQIAEEVIRNAILSQTRDNTSDNNTYDNIDTGDRHDNTMEHQDSQLFHTAAEMSTKYFSALGGQTLNTDGSFETGVMMPGGFPPPPEVEPGDRGRQMLSSTPLQYHGGAELNPGQLSPVRGRYIPRVAQPGVPQRQPGGTPGMSGAGSLLPHLPPPPENAGEGRQALSQTWDNSVVAGNLDPQGMMPSAPPLGAAAGRLPPRQHGPSFDQI